MNYSTISRRGKTRRSWRNPGGSRSAVSFGQLQALRAGCINLRAGGDFQIDYGSGRIRATGKLIADTPACELLQLLHCGGLMTHEADMVTEHLKRLPEHGTYEEDLQDPAFRAFLRGEDPNLRGEGTGR